MSKLTELRDYSREFAARATQLNTLREARQWMEGKVPAAEAAKWASLGFYYGEAAPHIAAGIDADTFKMGEDISTEVAGGPELRAMDSIDRMVAGGLIVDPARVRMVQDPSDPYHTIVTILD